MVVAEKAVVHKETAGSAGQEDLMVMRLREVATAAALVDRGVKVVETAMVVELGARAVALVAQVVKAGKATAVAAAKGQVD